MFIILLHLFNQICLVSGVHQKLGYFNYEVNSFCERHIAKYFLERKKYEKRGHKKNFLIKREKIKKEFLSSITKINNPFINIVNKYIRHIYSKEHGESFKRLLSKAFFIVLEQIYIKFAIQFSEFYNCYTSKKKDIKSILFVIFDIKKIRRINQKINESFTPILNYFFSTYLYEDLRYFPKDLKDKIRNSDPGENGIFEIFQNFFSSLQEKNSKLLQTDKRNYFKLLLRIKKDYSQSMKILEYFVERMFSSKEFKVLSNFIVPLKLIENSFVAINKGSTSLKTYHKLIGQIILQFKCIEFVLFGGESFLLTKKYIPRYKIEILKKLRFRILFYVWDTMNHNSSLFLKEIRDYFLLLCFENFLKIYNENLIERYLGEDDLSLEYLNFKNMASKYNVLILWLHNKII